MSRLIWMFCVTLALGAAACVPVNGGGDGGLDGGGEFIAGAGGGEAEAGSGGEAEAGAGGEVEAGSGGGDELAGAGGEAEAGAGGEAEAGAGGEVEAGSGGAAEAGAGGEAQAGAGGEVEAGAGGDEPPCDEAEGLDFEVEPNEDLHEATPVASALPIEATIGAEDDEDWFVFKSCGELILEIALSNAPAVASPVDLIFEIYGVGGELEMGEEHDYDGGDGTTLLTRSVYIPEAGDYHIRVFDHGRNDVDEAPYTLSLRARPVPDAEAEPNGNSRNRDLLMSIATPIADGVPHVGYIASEGDEDWFALDVPGESILQLELDNAPAFNTPLDLVYQVLAPDGDAELGEEHDYDGGDGTTQLSRNLYLEGAGRYFVRVYDHGNNDDDYDQPFTLTATLLPVPDEAAEPNGNTGNDDLDLSIATLIEDGVSVEGFIASKGDEDWFHLTSDGERILTVTLTNAPAFSSPLDLTYEVFNVDRGSLGEEHDYDGSDSAIHLERNLYLPEAGDYYIRVHDHGNNDYDYEQPYQLTARLLPVPDEAAEPNGGTDNPDLIRRLATPIANGEEVFGFIASEGDRDWYKITIGGGGGDVLITYTNAPAAGSPVDPVITLFDARVTEMIDEAHDYDGDDEATELRLGGSRFNPGDYYIRVHDNGDDDYDYAQGYRLVVTHP